MSELETRVRESSRNAIRSRSFRAGTAGSGHPSGRCAGDPPTGRTRAPSPRAGLRRAVRCFAAESRGGVALESAFVLLILTVAFAGVMTIVGERYETDRMARAARAVARATALDPGADACSAVRRELHLAADFSCHDTWGKIDVHRGLLPSELSAGLRAEAPAGAGDMVLVRIYWSRATWSVPGLLRSAEATPEPPSKSLVAIGLARSEPTA